MNKQSVDNKKNPYNYYWKLICVQAMNYQNSLEESDLSLVSICLSPICNENGIVAAITEHVGHAE